MVAFAVTSALGLLISIIGIINMTGNISSLHWYHRQRVTEENRKPFGKLIGTGTLTVGISIMIFGILFMIFEKTQLDIYVIIGTVVMIAGTILGLIISLYAMIKYNKGIF